MKDFIKLFFFIMSGFTFVALFIAGPVILVALTNNGWWCLLYILTIPFLLTVYACMDSIMEHIIPD
jgi:hypothetical protein